MKLDVAKGSGFNLTPINERMAGAVHQAEAQGAGILGQSMDVVASEAKRLEREEVKERLEGDFLYDDGLLREQNRRLSADLNVVNQKASDGQDWRKALGDVKVKYAKLPEFRTDKSRHRFEQGLLDAYAEVEQKAANEYKRFSVARAKSNFAMDYQTAMEDGEYEKAQAVLHGGLGTYVTLSKYQSEVKKLGRMRKERIASDMAQNDPQAFVQEMWNPESELHELPASYLARLQQTLVSDDALVSLDFSGKPGKNFSQELFNENEEENEVYPQGAMYAHSGGQEGVQAYEGGASGANATGGGERSKKVKLRSGVASPLGHLYRLYEADGRVPSLEAVLNTAQAEIEATDLTPYIRSGVDSMEFKKFMAGRQAEWERYDVPASSRKDLSDYVVSLVEAKVLRPEIDVNGILGFLEKSGELIPTKDMAYDLEGTTPEYFSFNGVKLSVSNSDLNGLLGVHDFAEKYDRRGKEVVKGYRQDEGAVKLALGAYVTNYIKAHPEASGNEIAKIMKEKHWDLTGRSSDIFGVVGAFSTQGTYQESERAYNEETLQKERAMREQKQKDIAVGHLDELKQASERLDREQELRPLRLNSKRVPLAVAAGYEDDALIIGRDYLKQIGSLEDLDELGVKAQFRLADGRIYSPREVRIVDGSVFGLGKKAAQSLLMMPGQIKPCPMEIVFPKKAAKLKGSPLVTQ